MLTLRGNDIYRENEKIGWLQDSHVFDHEGKKLGYFDASHVFDADAKKIAYVEGDDVFDETGCKKLKLEEANEAIEGVLPEIAKCAIYILLGN